MLLLLDIGNTHTHLGLANDRKVVCQAMIPTAAWFDGIAPRKIWKFIPKKKLSGSVFCSVVPKASPICASFLEAQNLTLLQLTHKTCRGVGIDYPRPASIGADRLANAIAARAIIGAPSVVVDFGTAVTFDVIDRNGNYVGGIIAPGVSAMTDYLHEKTALLPRITIRDPKGIIGKNTEQAMLVGAIHGYRGLIRGLVQELKRELNARRLPVVATGGYAELIADDLPEITSVLPSLTLEGLRLLWEAHQPG